MIRKYCLFRTFPSLFGGGFGNKGTEKPWKINLFFSILAIIRILGAFIGTGERKMKKKTQLLKAPIFNYPLVRVSFMEQDKDKIVSMGLLNTSILILP